MKLPFTIPNRLIQGNFDALLKLLVEEVDFERVGPITGSGGSVASGTSQWFALAGMSFTYTPTRRTHALIQHNVRLNSAVAAWAFAATGHSVSPAPVSRHAVNAPAAGVAAGPDLLTLIYLHNGGVAGAHLVGYESMILAAGVTYTIATMAVGGGAAGSIVWPATAENNMVGTFCPEP
jgi:hypothetical protein